VRGRDRGGATDAPAERTLSVTLFASLFVGRGTFKDAKEIGKEGGNVGVGVATVCVIIVAV